MEKARVALFEDEPFFINGVEAALQDSEHSLVAVGNDVGSSEAILRKIYTGSLLVHVVLLDGNLNPEQQSRDGRDANRLFQYMLDHKLVSPDGVDGLKVVGFSRNEWWENGIKAHRDPGKDCVPRLPDIISGLQPTDGWLKRQY